MSENSNFERIDKIVQLAEQARQEADRLYNKKIKKAATDYRNLMLEITKIIKDERPAALEFSKNIKKD